MMMRLWMLLATIAFSAMAIAQNVSAVKRPPNLGPPVYKFLEEVDPLSNGKATPKRIILQIVPQTNRIPSEFLALGDRIPYTNLRIAQYTYKAAYNLTTGASKNVSEVTVENVITGKTAVMVYDEFVDLSAVDKVP